MKLRDFIRENTNGVDKQAIREFVMEYFEPANFTVTDEGQISAPGVDLRQKKGKPFPNGEMPYKVKECRSFYVRGITSCKNFPTSTDINIGIEDSPHLRDLTGLDQEVQKCLVISLHNSGIESLNGLPKNITGNLYIGDCTKLSDIQAISPDHTFGVGLWYDVSPTLPILRLAFDEKVKVGGMNDKTLKQILQSTPKTSTPTTRQGLELIDQLLSNGYDGMVRY